MSLKYGLNVKKPATAAPTRRTIFDDENEDASDENARSEAQPPRPAVNRTKGSKPPLKGPPTRAPTHDSSRQDLSTLQSASSKITAATEIDPSIFDYDSFHTAKTNVLATRQAASRQDALDRKPKYINNLLSAAARRKQDQQVAREKLLQREREAEGDEFADKEKFVTGAYKQQQEETRRLEEEEKQKAEDEARRRAHLGGGGMQTFYRTMLDETEREHQATVAAAEAEFEQRRAGDNNNNPHEASDRHQQGGTREKTDAQLAAEMKAKGVSVHLNEDGQITDKRQLLSAGLNVGTAGRGGGGDSHAADHLRTGNRNAKSAFAEAGARAAGESKHAQRERQSRMMEEQLASQAKRAREEAEEERERLTKAAKSTKSEKDVSDAKARYLARKAAKERGEG